MTPIRGADFPDRAASFQYACERLRVLGEVLATSHVIEHASVPVEARVVTLEADAQGIITDFARAVLAP
jgi:phage baseplate assembly protein gpV